VKLHILAVGTSTENEVARLRVQPDFRKATSNMIRGSAAIEPIAQRFSQLENAAAVLGSAYGELAVTRDFLGTLETQGIARPLLFQSSLHNATLGFLAIRYGIRGPSVTLSDRHFSGEQCLEAAALLLGSGSSLCLALGVESRVQPLEAAQLENLPVGTEPGEGATALLLASEDAARELGVVSLAVIEGLERASGWTGAPVSGSYYGSDALERLAHELATLPRTAGVRELNFPKPNGDFSTIRLRLPC
jgi:hypothetical protein